MSREFDIGNSYQSAFERLNRTYHGEEPYRDLEKRFWQRLSSPRASLLLEVSSIDFLRVLFKDFDDPDGLQSYRALTNYVLVLAFGERANLIELDRPIVLGKRDQAVLANVKKLAKLLGQIETKMVYDYSQIRQILNRIPKLTLAKCDQGEFDGYNQEVLIRVEDIEGMLRSAIDGRCSLKDESFRLSLLKLMPFFGMDQMISGIESSQRAQIWHGMVGLSLYGANQLEWLLEPDKRYRKPIGQSGGRIFNRLLSRLNRRPSDIDEENIPYSGFLASSQFVEPDISSAA